MGSACGARAGGRRGGPAEHPFHLLFVPWPRSGSARRNGNPFSSAFPAAKWPRKKMRDVSRWSSSHHGRRSARRASRALRGGADLLLWHLGGGIHRTGPGKTPPHALLAPFPSVPWPIWRPNRTPWMPFGPKGLERALGGRGPVGAAPPTAQSILFFISRSSKVGPPELNFGSVFQIRAYCFAPPFQGLLGASKRANE